MILFVGFFAKLLGRNRRTCTLQAHHVIGLGLGEERRHKRKIGTAEGIEDVFGTCGDITQIVCADGFHLVKRLLAVGPHTIQFSRMVLPFFCLSHGIQRVAFLQRNSSQNTCQGIEKRITHKFDDFFLNWQGVDNGDGIGLRVLGSTARIEAVASSQHERQSSDNHYAKSNISHCICFLVIILLMKYTMIPETRVKALMRVIHITGCSPLANLV